KMKTSIQLVLAMTFPLMGFERAGENYTRSAGTGNATGQRAQFGRYCPANQSLTGRCRGSLVDDIVPNTCGHGKRVARMPVEKPAWNAGLTFAALFEDAHKRRFDCVLFWALDRFTREGRVPTIMHLQRLADCGVGFHSYTEAHLATDNELLRNILLAV